MNKPSKNALQQSKLILEELEERRLFSGGIEGLIDTGLDSDANAIYSDINGSSTQTDNTGTDTAAAEQRSQEVVFVDLDVDNHQQLVDDLLANSDTSRNIEVVVLNQNKDGIEEISEFLSERDDLDAVHIISHGDDGSIQLGNTELNAATLEQNNLKVALWANAFAETGDILIYGCNLAETEAGQSLINDISSLTLADVAASTDLTGHASLGGDWHLELNVGSIETTVAVSDEAQQAWQAVLAVDAEDAFSGYPVGDLDGNAGGAGFTDAWTSFSGSDNIQVVTTGLTHPTSGPDTTDAIQLNQTGLFDSFYERTLASPYGTVDETIWVSFLIEPQEQAGAGSYMGVVLGDGGGYFNTNQLFFGYEDSAYKMNNWSGGGTHHVDATAVVPGETAFLVLRLDISSSGNDTATLFVNPNSGEPTPSVSGTTQKVDLDLTNLDTVTLVGGAVTANPSLMGGLRIGSSFADVAPAGPNSAPVAVADAVNTDEDTAVLIDVLANDSDPDTDPLTARMVTGPTNGTLVPSPVELINETNLTNDAANDREAQMSPDGSQIVFRSDRSGGNNDIWVMDADGSNPVQLTSDPGSDIRPVWSPDGTQILFTSDRSGDKEIWIMNADGSGQTNLTNNALGDDRAATWSPDGSQITFVSTRDGNDEIYVMNANGTGQVNITNNAAKDSGADWSPDGTKILFVSDRGGNSDIYVMDADGSNPVNLSNNAAVDTNASWSPDGSKIVFKTDRDSNEEIYVMDADGSNQTRLTDNAFVDGAPSWTPDGSQIIFQTSRDGNHEIYIADISSDGTFTYTPDADFTGIDSFTYVANDGTLDSAVTTVTITVDPVNDAPILVNNAGLTAAEGSTTVITNARLGYADAEQLASSIVYSVTSSPVNGQLELTTNPDVAITSFTQDDIDNSRVVYVHNGSETTADSFGFTVDDGQGSYAGGPSIAGIGTLTNVTSGISNARAPDYSPDGSKIVFARNNDIYIMDADGSNQTPLVTAAGGDFQAVWSPDGSKIAFTSNRDGNNEIYVIDADGNNETRITTTTNLVSDSAPAWSPDSSKIAFTSDSDGDKEIWVMDANGTNLVQLTTDGGVDGGASWSPDGSKIVFQSTRDGGDYEIWVMDADGNNQTRLTTEAGVDALGDWSPDGSKLLFYSERDGNREIYVMDADGNNPVRLTNDADIDTEAEWSPDGSSILFSSNRDGDYDIYSANVIYENTFAITVTPANDAPVVATTGTTLAYTENDAATPVDPGLSLSDVDSPDLTGATVTISANYENGDDVLAFTNQLGISGSWDAATGTLTLSGNASVADYQTALQSVTFVNSSEMPSELTRTVSFQVDDGTDLSNIATRDITVNAVNDAPIARPDGVYLSFDGDDFVEVADDPSLQMTNEVTMEAWINPTGSGTGSKIILNKEGEYELGITADTGEIKFAIAKSDNTWAWHNTGYFATAGEWTHVAVTYDGIAGEAKTYINGALVDTFSQSGAVGDVYAGFNNLWIGGRENDPADRFDGQIDEVRVWSTVRTQGEVQTNMDGQLSGAEAGLAGNWRLEEAAGGAVLDQSANGNDGVLGGSEGAAATPSYQGYITDQNTILNITAISGVLANDSDIDPDSLSVTNLDTTGMLGNLVLNTADGSFSYNPNGAFDYLDAGEQATETFTYTANDGTVDSNTVTVTLTVVGINDAPVVATTGTTLAYTENDAATPLDPGLSLSDLENADLTGATVTISANYANGQDVLAFTDQLGISGSWDAATGTLTLSGDASVADYQTALQSVTFVNTSEMPSELTRTVSFQVDDGTDLSNIATRDITVNAVNDVPVATGNIVVTTEDVPLVIGAGDFSFTDVESDSLVSVTISGLNLNGGTLTHSAGAVNVTNGMTITAAQLADLTFTSALNDSTDSSFTYTVNDAGTGVTSAVMNITVNAANDAPVAVDDGYAVNEDATLDVDWWDTDWTARRTFTLDNSAQGENLVDFPVLVVLDPDPVTGNIDYAKTQNDGADLRFFAADGTALDYDIEEWDEGGFSSVWVKVPLITAGSSSDSITMYYGNAGAPAGENAEAVWSNGFEAVQHLNDDLLDESANNNDGVNSGSINAAGQVADGQLFDGSDDYVNLGSGASVDDIFAGGGTVSAWINPSSWGENGYGRIFDKSDATIPTAGWALEMAQGTSSLLFQQGFSGSVGSWASANNSISVGPDVWQYVTLSYDSSSPGNTPSFYVNGVSVATVVDATPTGTAVGDGAIDLHLGNFAQGTVRTFDGTIDDVRMSSEVRSADWIRAQHLSTSNSFVNFVPGEETAPLESGLLGNDSDVDNDAQTVTLVSGPSNAAAFTLYKNGTFSYTPNANYNGPDSFTYVTNDGTADSNVATVSITVNAVADAAVIGGDDAGGVTEDLGVVAGNITDSGSLTVTDADAGESSFQAATITGTYGDLSIDAAGNWSYSANNSQAAIQGLGPGEIITDTLTVSSFDGTTHEVVITITGVNDAPVANDDAYSVDEDQVLTISAVPTPPTAVYTFDEGSGQVVSDSSGNGADGTLGDSSGAAANDPAWSTSDRTGGSALQFDGSDDFVQTTSSDLQTAMNFTLSAWFKTDTTSGQQHILWQGIGTENGWGDPGGTALTSAEMHLSVGHWSSPDNISFFLGWDEADPNSIDIISSSTFTDTSEWHHASVVVTDIGGGNLQADLYVDGVLEGSDSGNQIDRSGWDTDLRISGSGSGARSFDGTIDEVGIWTEALTPAQVTELWQSGVMANDTDTDGSALSASLVTGPSNGSLTFNADGSFEYTPDADFNGVDSFTYIANDGTVDSNVATVTITVNAVNDVPVATGNTVIAAEDVPLVIGPADFNFTDVESDSLASVTITGLNLNGGTLSHSGGAVTVTNGMTITAAQLADLTFTSAANDSTDSSFTYTVNDAGTGVTSAVMNITVNAVNDVPVATGNTVIASEDVPLVIGVSDFNFTDVEGDSLASVTITGLNLNGGTLTHSGGAVTVTNGMTITAAQLADLTFSSALNDSTDSSFTYTVNDAGTGVTSAVMNITVNAVNDVPVATGNTVIASEDVPLVIGVSDFNFTDVEGDSLASVTITGLNLNGGTLTHSAGAVTVTNGMTITAAQLADLTFTSALNDSTDSSFTYTVNDAGTGVTSAVMNITVNAVNDVPVATGNTVIASEDVPLVIGPADFNFTDVEGDSLASVTITGLNLNGGTLTHSAGAATVTNGMTITAAQLADLTFTSALNDDTDSSFTYTVNDAGTGVTSAVMNITVNAVNDVPVATGNTVIASEDVPLVIGASDFNFTDVEGDSLASVTITGLNLNGGTLTHSAGAVTVTNGMTITAAQLADLTFTSAANDSTDSSFTYTVNDAGTGVTSAVMNITVNAVNDVPVATGNTVIAAEDVPLVINASDFNFTDVEGDSLASVTITGLNLNSGTLTHSGGAVTVTNGMTITAAQLADLTFTSAANDSTDSSFTYTVNDAGTGVTSAVMNITVNAVNDVPVATGNTVIASEDVPLVIGASDFNFTDVESDSLASVTITGLNLNGGTLTHSGGAVTVTNGMTITAAQLADLTFTSASNDSTDSSFTYTVNDAGTGVTSAVMNITVNAVNDVPVATGNTVIAAEDVPLVINASDFNFTDVEGDSLASVTITGLNLNGGTLTHSGGAVTVTNGMTITAAQLADLTFTSAANDSTDSSFTYTVNDAGLGVTSAVMNITVNAVNDVPVATGNTVIAAEDVPLVINASDFNFTDVEGDSLASVTITGLNLNGGTLTHSGGAVTVTNGMTITAAQLADLTFTSAANDSTDSSFTYTVNDAGLGVTSAIMNITVNAANDVPVATGNTVIASEDVPLVIGPSDFNYTDTESDSMASVTITGLNLNGGTLTHSGGAVTVTNGMTITAAQLADLTFTSSSNDSTDSSFTYTVNDAGTGVTSAVMNITVNAVNDVPVATGNTVIANEDVPLVIGASDFNFTDVESDSLASVTITGLNLNGGTLTHSGGAVTVTNGMTITAAQLADLTFTSAANDSTDSSFTYTVNDAGLGVTSAVMNITVNAVNDVPVATGNTVIANEDVPLVIGPADFNFTDVESDSLASVTITGLNLNGGTLTHSGGAVTVTNGMTITAAQLADLTFTSAANDSTDSSFTYTVNDAGTGVTSAIMNITVNAVNDVPVATGNTVIASEDVPLVIGPTDFNFTDVESDSLASVTITGLNLNGGTLTHSGGAVTVTNGMTITAAQLADLTFTSSSNDSTDSSFTYTVNDAGTGVTSAVMNITVNAVNDVPVATGNTVIANEDVPLVIGASDFNFTDVESDSLASVTITGLNLNGGTLTHSGGAVTVTNGMTITAAQLADLTFTSASNDSTDSSFTYTVNDAGTGVTSAVMNITVNAVNDVPVASGNTVIANEDVPLVIGPADFNYTDTESDSLASVTITGLNLNGGTLTHSGGAVTVTNGMTITAAQLADLTFTSASNDSTDSSFTYTVNDAGTGVTSAVMNITVNAVNDVPVASGNTVIASEDVPLVIGQADFNFTDVESDSLASVTITGLNLNGGTLTHSGGAVTVTNGMTITAAQLADLTFTSAADDSTDSSFTYTVNDAGTGVTSAVMNITVNAVNDVPVATGNTVIANEDVPLVIGPADFDFTDVEGDSLASVTITGLNLNGGTLTHSGGAVTVTNGMTITAAQLADLTFTSALNDSTDSSFTYTVNDAGLGVTSAIMNITVNAVNDVPVATGNTVIASEDVPLVIGPGDFNYTDTESDSLASVTITGLNLNGGTLTHSGGAVNVTSGMTITAAQLADLTFTSASNDSTDSSFTYTVNDAGTGVTSAVMNITVNAVNDVPIATGNTVIASEDVPLVIGPSDFNFTDVEGDSLASVTITGLNLNGGTLIHSGGAVTVTNGMTITAAQLADLTFTSALNDSTDSSFTYTVNDAGLGVTSAVMNITVNAVNDVPVATGNTVIASEDVPLVIGASDFNFSDVESDSLASVTITGLNLNGGTLTHSGGAVTVTNGMTITAAQLADLTFTSASNDSTDSSFTYTVNDAGLGVTSAVMNITVNAVNDVPVATGNTVIASEDVSLVIGASDFNFTDVEGDSLASVTITGLNLNGGTLTHSGGAVTVTNGMTITAAQLADLTFTSAANDSTDCSFTYTVNDAGAGVTSAVMNITVNAVNDVPVATGNTVVTTEDVPLVIGAGDFSFSDVESDSLASVTITGLNLNGGTLTHSGGAVTVTNGMTITAAQLADLTFTSALNDDTDCSFTYSVNDAGTGVTSAVMNIVVNAFNNLPVIGGVDTATITEDLDLLAGNLTAAGALTIADADIGESSFIGETITGAYGNLAIDAAGNWSYSADNSQAAIQSLRAGESVTDTLSVTTADGSTHDVVVTIDGAAEAAPPPVVEPPVDEPPPEEVIPPPEEAAKDEDDGGEDGILEEITRLPQGSAPPVAERDESDVALADEPEGEAVNFGPVADKQVPDVAQQPQVIQAQHLDVDSLTLQVSDDEALNQQYELELLNRIDSMHLGMDSDGARQSADDVNVQIVVGSTASLTVGIVSWVLRGGALLASFMSTVPLLNRFDPLPILKTREDEEDVEPDEDDEGNTQFKEHARKVDSMFSGDDGEQS